MKKCILVSSLLCCVATTVWSAPAGPDPVAIAEVEALRRQERKLVMDANLSQAKKLQKEKNYRDAAKLYEEAIGHAQLLGGVETVEKSYRDALAGLIECRLQLGVALQEKYEFKAAAAEVDKIFPFDPRNSDAEKFKRFNDVVESAHRGRVPSQGVLSLQPKLAEQRTEVLQLVRDGQLYWQMGEYQEAKTKLEAAIKKDPLNEAAFFYLRLVMESEFDIESKKRDKTYGDRVVEVTKKWNENTRGDLPKPNLYFRTNSYIPFLTHTSDGAQRINRKLDQIVFPEITYDGLPLPEVVKLLDGETKKYDPEKKGLNFMINNVVVDYTSLNVPTPGGGAGGAAAAAAAAAPLLDPMGNPIAAAAAGTQKPDLDTALVKVTTVLRDLTLRQVLDVICKTAEVKMPDGRSAGLKFSIEEYAIVFSPKLPEQASLFARTFKVNPDTFVQGLQSVVGNPIQAVTQAGGAGGQGGGGGGGGQQGGLGGAAGGGGGGGQQGSQFTIAGVSVAGQSQGGGGGGGGGGGLRGVTSTNLTAELNLQVREYFLAAGVVNLGVSTGPDATQVFFNDRNGLLLVRASLQDLDIIQMAIELLNSVPPQVLVESRFCEINQNDNKALGFDWFIGNTRFGNFAGQPGTQPSLTGRPSAANPTGVFPLPASPIGALASDGSLTGNALRNNGPALGTITGILTDPQFRVVIRALEQRDGTDVLQAAKVITVSGRQAQIQVTDVQFILTGITAQQTGGGGGGGGGVGPGGGGGAAGAIGSTLQPQTTILPTGPVLDVLPTVAADGYTISMSLIPSITQFIGYDAVPPEFAGAIQAQSVGSGTVGVSLTAQVPLPRTRVRQVVTQCIVWDAQTVMLGGLISEDIVNTKDKVPVLGDLPLVGRLFRSETKTNKKKNLVIFVTPTIIDPAGNRVHTDEEMPFAASNTPAQPSPIRPN